MVKVGTGTQMVIGNPVEESTGSLKSPDNKTEHMPSVFPELSDIPEQHRLLCPLIQREFLLGGELHTWSGATQSVMSPICIHSDSGLKKVYVGEYPLLTKAEALQAIDAAVKAYDGGLGVWPAMKSEERISCMEKFVDGMRGKRAEVVKLIMYEIGKTLPDAQKEFDRTVSYIQQTIEALRKINGEQRRIVTVEGLDAKLGRISIGSVLCVAPFNYPLNETFTTLIPALLMGNTVVFKPAKLGVLLHQPLLELFRDCFPAGVVNTVYGEGQEVLTPLMKSGKIDVFAFIGSTGVAEILLDAHQANHRLTSILGLGAKNAGIILADADLTSTVKDCVAGSLSFNGQRCTALKILFVHRSFADEFVGKFSAAVSALKLGMPWEPGVSITPLAEEGKPEKMLAYVNDAVENGASIVNERGGMIEGTSFFPAVIYPVDSRMKLYYEEQFGPVVPIVIFDNPEEVVSYVKDSELRQQVSIFGKVGRDLDALADRFSLLVPRVNLNTQCQRGPDELPFTGKRSSALGTLSIVDALMAFSLPSVKAAKHGGFPTIQA